MRDEGPSYAHNIGLSLDVNQTSTNSQRETNSSILQILKKVNLTTCKLQLPNYEDLIPSSEVRPVLTGILFEPQKTYRFVVFDIETASTARTTELLQLSAITEDEKAFFSEYILPKNSISSNASAIHNITVGIFGRSKEIV